MDSVSGSMYLNTVYWGVGAFFAGLTLITFEARIKRFGRKAVHTIIEMVVAGCLITFFVITATGKNKLDLLPKIVLKCKNVFFR